MPWHYGGERGSIIYRKEDVTDQSMQDIVREIAEKEGKEVSFLHLGAQS